MKRGLDFASSQDGGNSAISSSPAFCSKTASAPPNRPSSRRRACRQPISV
ncbi:MAG: hypothetical protein WC360_09075 [Opitutales bacterium]